MAIQDEKQNTYNIFCYDDKGKPLYIGKNHIVEFPNLVKEYGQCSIVEKE